ncbi:hypothetical protein Val02_74920 [Virgisporangium aliadipatigenens]|uniref:Uncharacterized protein n=1 Tax=Virgisporangium aliadipatigenens TaxID=741659 RepID=A0A8J4DUP6_9ACTN|nr:hypothetical protein [Virgisporangium aliadipatigenens]GIJ50606.1 hypothetical protein Val02_74920 [Virgisporangium aliadipatigenens]
MTLDGYQGSGRVLVLRGPRGPAGAVLGYVWWFAAAAALAAAGWWTVAGYEGSRPVLSVLYGVLIFLVVFLPLGLIVAFGLNAAHLKGLDGGSGIPLAELSPEGVHVRYRGVRARERRRGLPDSPPYDAAAPWSVITGWRPGRGPFGEPVLVLDIDSPDELVTHPNPRGAPTYAARLREATSSPLAVRTPRAVSGELPALRRMLAEYGVHERPLS